MEGLLADMRQTEDPGLAQRARIYIIEQGMGKPIQPTEAVNTGDFDHWSVDELAAFVRTGAVPEGRSLN